LENRLKAARLAAAVNATPPEISDVSLTEDPDLRCLVAQWEKQRAARPDNDIPLRAVASAEIGRLLKYCHLCDVIDGGRDFRFKIVGADAFPRIECQMGKLVSEHPDAGSRLRLPIQMRAAIEARKPVRGTALRETDAGNFYIEAVWLPYGDSEVRQVLGMVAFRCKLDGTLLPVRPYDILA